MDGCEAEPGMKTVWPFLFVLLFTLALLVKLADAQARILRLESQVRYLEDARKIKGPK